jgi:hypothetical protein
VVVNDATLLRLCDYSVDVLECPKCHGRLRVVAVVTERDPVRHILAHLGLPTEPPSVARARDPTDDVGDRERENRKTGRREGRRFGGISGRGRRLC